METKYFLRPRKFLSPLTQLCTRSSATMHTYTYTQTARTDLARKKEGEQRCRSSTSAALSFSDRVEARSSSLHTMIYTVSPRLAEVLKVSPFDFYLFIITPDVQTTVVRGYQQK